MCSAHCLKPIHLCWCVGVSPPFVPMLPNLLNSLCLKAMKKIRQLRLHVVRGVGRSSAQRGVHMPVNHLDVFPHPLLLFASYLIPDSHLI